jgi:uncharacterized protein YceH (UPF0502 family)
MILDAIQQRVLGALMEKEMTTPENYPLSLNALIAACNQRSSREPVLDLTEDEVRQGVHTLEDMDIVAPVRDARVPKYEHRIRTVLNLRRDETAILCLLLLRGPQTPGELRGRAERMFRFDDIAAVQSALERMAGRTAETDQAGSGQVGTGPLAVQLARQPGSRESRYAHLLGGPVRDRVLPAERAHSSFDHPSEQMRSPGTPTFDHPSEQVRSPGTPRFDHPGKRQEAMQARVAELEAEVASLRARVEALEGRG